MTLDENNTVHKCLTVAKDGNTFENIFTPTSVEDGLEVGDSDDTASATSQVGSKYKWHDGMAVPGLWDGHGHVLNYGEMLESVQLFGAGSLEGV